MSFRRFRPTSLLLLLASYLLCTAAGCGGHNYGPTGKITGRLTMDGKPLSPGHCVSFMEMQKGFLAFGQTDADGKFEVNTWNQGNMPIGKYKVMIAPPPTKEPTNLTPEQAFEQGARSPAPARLPFPRRYGETTTSGLEYEIKSGDNHFDIDLQSK